MANPLGDVPEEQDEWAEYPSLTGMGLGARVGDAILDESGCDSSVIDLMWLRGHWSRDWPFHQ